MTSVADVPRPGEGGPDAGDDQIAAAVSAVRRATTTLLGAGREASGLADAARRLHALADDLETRAPSARDRMETMDRQGRVLFYGSVVGIHNAIAPPVDFRVVDGGLVATLALTVAHERAPGVVHEGVVAMLLDVALAEANNVASRAGVTAQLNIDFHAPVPSGRELVIRSRQDRVDGRKLYSSGDVWLGEQLLVSSDGLFISRKIPGGDA